MNSLQLKCDRSMCFCLSLRIITGGLFFLTLFGFCQSSFAQDSQARPVARLLTGPVSDITNSRPRRVLEASAALEVADLKAFASFTIENATAIERRAFEKTNEVRKQNGLEPFIWDAQLCQMARVHSESMARLGYFSHETPEGSLLKERARAAGILHFRVLGENIAYNRGHDDPGAFAVERWMISPAHRANILYVGFQAVATGSFVSSDGSVYITQIFITR